MFELLKNKEKQLRLSNDQYLALLSRTSPFAEELRKNLKDRKRIIVVRDNITIPKGIKNLCENTVFEKDLDATNSDLEYFNGTVKGNACFKDSRLESISEESVFMKNLNLEGAEIKRINFPLKVDGNLLIGEGIRITEDKNINGKILKDSKEVVFKRCKNLRERGFDI